MSSPTQKQYTLFPEISPYNTGNLKVSNIHTIYYEECGNKNGKPVVIVHGGPGGGISPFYRQFFDPNAYRIILFDQRGAGQSKPHACLEENTTQDLVEDMEKLRKELKLEKWMVFGGSWGSTLSIAYAIKHTSCVTHLVLRGIFLLRASEIRWFYELGGAENLFPDAFEAFKAPIPVREHHNLLAAYHRRLTGTNEEEKLKCARSWSIWEMTTSRLVIDPDYIKRAADDDQFSLAFARIESHYFTNAGFFEHDGELLAKAHLLNSIPGVIVQGRYDCVCPPKSAFELSKRWTKGKLIWCPMSGHSCKEPEIIHELVKATEQFKND